MENHLEYPGNGHKHFSRSQLVSLLIALGNTTTGSICPQVERTHPNLSDVLHVRVRMSILGRKSFH